MFLHFNFYFVILTETKATTRRTQEQGTPCPPARPPDVYIKECKTRADIGKFLRPMDFFKLFFTPCMIGMLGTYTNDYANTVGPQKPSLYQSWSNTYPEEFYHFIGLLMYMSRVPNIEKYWSKKSFYHGLWACSFMVKKRFKQLMSFLKISNVRTEDPDDKLSKARFLMEFISRKCLKLF